MPLIYVAIVDDDESVCRSFGRLLTAAGFQPVMYPSAESFPSGHEAPSVWLSLCSTSSWVP